MKQQIFFTLPDRIMDYINDQLMANPQFKKSDLGRHYFILGFGLQRYNQVKYGQLTYEQDRNNTD